MQQRRSGEVGEDKDIHRDVTEFRRRADGLGDAKTTEDFHAAGVATLHLWELARLRALLDDANLNPAAGEVQPQGGPDRAGASDQHLAIESAIHVRINRP